MRKKRKYQRCVIVDGEYTFVSPSVVADEYGKSYQTIFRWIDSGFVFELGWKVRRVPVNRILVGIPNNQFISFRDKTLLARA